MRLKKLFISILALGSLAALPVIANAKNSGVYTRNDDGTVGYTSQETITLHSADAAKETTLNLDNFNADAPRECTRAGFVCNETTEIIVSTHKTWRPMRLYPLTSEQLTTDMFARFYPNLSETPRLDGSSPAAQRLIAQRMLYELGLLPVLPTGKFGFMTETGTMQFQCAVGVEEFDPKRGSYFIGPQTIGQMNKWKENMKTPGYLDSYAFQAPDLRSCSENMQTRAEFLGALKKEAASQPNTTVPGENASGAKVPVNEPNYLQLEGEVIIKKK